MGFFFGGGASVADMVGATTSASGTAGLVPAPASGTSRRALFSDATFAEFPLVPARKAANTLWVSPKMFGIGGSAAGGAPAARRRQFGLGFFPADGTIDTLGCRLNTGPATAVNVHLGIWECGEDGLPSTYIAGGTASSGTTNFTDISISIGSISVKRGFFYNALTLETSAGSWNGNNMGSYGFSSFLGVSGNPAGNGQSPFYTATTYNQTTHESFSFDDSVIYQVSYQWA